MARKSNGPWFRADKGGWFVWHEGKRINLHVRGPGSEVEAVRAWRRLMAGDTTVSLSPKTAPVKVPDTTGKDVLTAFLAYSADRVKANTLRTYRELLTPFGAVFPTAANAITPRAVYTYADRPGWGASYKHGMFGTIATAFRWATAEGMIPTNPLANLKRPPKASRGAGAVVSQDVHERLVEVASPELRTLLILLRETGARPSELARLTAADVDLTASMAVLSEHKTDHTGKPRIIILSPLAVAVLRDIAADRPTGTLLLNHRGRSWTKDSIGHAMRRAGRKAGVSAIAYGYRHGFATDALANGVPDATVAALLGHSGTVMLH